MADAALSEAWVLELARRQRMNTDVRKNIFCVIMTSEVGGASDGQFIAKLSYMQYKAITIDT